MAKVGVARAQSLLQRRSVAVAALSRKHSGAPNGSLGALDAQGTADCRSKRESLAGHRGRIVVHGGRLLSSTREARMCIVQALAVGAITYNIYQPINIQEKKIDVPVVNKIKEAKPLIEEDKKLDNIKSEKILNLQTIRVNPGGDVLIAGKTVPNSELNVISNPRVVGIRLRRRS